jgi:hypothetical protein
MVELGGRGRPCTPSIEVIDKPSEDDGHKGKGLSELAEAEQARRPLCTPHSTYRASTTGRETSNEP